MIRRTKVVATLGPASSDAKTLTRMIDAGLDVVRINFSHGTPDEHRARVNLVRQLARKAGRAVGVLVDLQGPKIRVGRFKDGKINLEPGAKFVLDAECKLGDQNVVGLDYKNLPNDVRPGDTLLLDDGRIVLGVTSVRGPKIFTVVEQGGPLSNNKGINRKGGGLTAPALTEKDKQDIKLAAELKADFLAVSFPRSGDDVRWARDLFTKAGGHGLIVSKIERAEAIPALEEILDASDAIMVARGDLAVEVGDAAVPALQKRMIRMAREKQKLTITATQMMESMISSPIPTRAEVSDVANAVLDGTDAVMTSAETAAGKYPAETIGCASKWKRKIRCCRSAAADRG
jgi:pyruvate kinase